MAIKETIDLNVTGFINSLNQARSKIAEVGDSLKTNLEKNVKVGIDTSSLKKVEAEVAKTAKSFEDSISDAGKKAGQGFSTNVRGGVVGGIKNAFKEGQDEANKGGGIFGSLAGTVGQLATPIGAATAAIGVLTGAMATVYSAGTAFQTGLQGVSAVTGLTGDDLDGLGNRARDLAKQFGGDATTQLDSFKGVLSRLGVGLADTPEQLGKISENINILSKAGGIDAAQAMDTLTSSMLQFGIDAEDPNLAAAESTRFINALAKSAEVGAAEIPQVGEAIVVAGVAAKQANVSFEETNAAIQVLAKGGKTGAEAGTALRNVLGKIAGEEVIPKEALAKLQSLGVDMTKVSDTSIPLAERLGELGKAAGDATAFAQVFGTENAAAANILATGADTIKDWTKEITGSNAASDQAAKNMDTLAERVDRAKAQVTDFAIGAFQAVAPTAMTIFDNLITSISTIGSALAEPFMDLGVVISEAFAPLGDLFTEIFGKGADESSIFKDALDGLMVVVKILINAALTPLKFAFNFVKVAIGLAVDVVQLIKKNFDDAYNSSALFRTIIEGIGQAFKAVGGFIGEVVDGIGDFFSALGKEKKSPLEKTKKDAIEALAATKDLKKAAEDVPPPPPGPSGEDAKKTNEERKKLQDEIEKYLLSSAARIQKGQKEIDKLQTAELIASLQERRKAIEEDVNISAKQRVAETLAIDLKVIDIEKEAKLKALRESFDAEMEAAKENTANFINEKKIEGVAKKALESSLKDELSQLERGFELSRQALVSDSEAKISDIRKKSYLETQKLLAEQALANGVLIEKAQEKALKDQQKGITAYNDLISSLSADADELSKKLADRFNAKKPSIQEDKTLERETESLRQQLSAREISYAAFVGSIKEKQSELEESIASPWTGAMTIVQSSLLGVSAVFEKALDESNKRFALSSKTFERDSKGQLVEVAKNYESMTQLLEDVSTAGLDVLTNTFAVAITSGQDAAGAVARSFLDLLQSLAPAITAMVFGITSASLENITSLGLWGAVKFAAFVGVFTGLIQTAKAQIGGAWTGALPGVKNPEATKNPNDNTMIWWNPAEAIVPANITKREMPLLKALFAGKSSEEFFRDNYAPSYHFATPSVNISGNDRADKLLEEIARNTAPKRGGRQAIEHEFKPLKLKGNDLVAEYKRSLARELRRV